jgi:hypothetical protein
MHSLYTCVNVLTATLHTLPCQMRDRETTVTLSSAFLHDKLIYLFVYMFLTVYKLILYWYLLQINTILLNNTPNTAHIPQNARRITNLQPRWLQLQHGVINGKIFYSSGWPLHRNALHIFRHGIHCFIHFRRVLIID